MGIITYYNKDNVGLNFLCCYTKPEVYEEYLLLHNTVLNTLVRLNGTPEQSWQLLKCLNNGIGDDELLKILVDDFSLGADDYICMLKNGIIE